MALLFTLTLTALAKPVAPTPLPEAVRAADAVVIATALRTEFHALAEGATWEGSTSSSYWVDYRVDESMHGTIPVGTELRVTILRGGCLRWERRLGQARPVAVSEDRDPRAANRGGGGAAGRLISPPAP